MEEVRSEGEIPEEIELDHQEEEVRYRSLGVAGICGVVALIAGLFVFSGLSDDGIVTAYSLQADSITKARRGEKEIRITPAPMFLSRMKVMDTVYTTDSVYLDVDLKKQHVTVKNRNGAEQTFRISSGNPAIPEGIATPTGLFTVQGMQPMAISKQFHDAKLHHWIGIQGGVGFHGLDGNGYYGTLGVRPSSHGCVRMAREEVAEMYKMVHPGAMIIVHNGDPARVVAFCASKDTANATLIDSAAVYSHSLGKERLRNLYDGHYWSDPQPRLVHLAGQKFRWGMEIGDVKRIPKQEVPEFRFNPAFYRYSVGMRNDRALASVLSPRVTARLARAADSLRAADRAEMKTEEKKIEYGN
ncbi:MAG: L,D-transpeptidase [Candidatus Kapaibacterium sp.]